MVTILGKADGYQEAIQDFDFQGPKHHLLTPKEVNKAESSQADRKNTSQLPFRKASTTNFKRQDGFKPFGVKRSLSVSSERQRSLQSFESESSSSIQTSIDSEHSLYKTCEAIFDEHFDEQYIERIKKKRNPRTINRDIHLVLPNENKSVDQQFEQSCRVLEHGIPAIKFNFSNSRSKTVMIKLTGNRRVLEYTNLQPSKSLASKVFGQTRRAPMEQFFEVIYGGSTSCFDSHKSTLMPIIRKRYQDNGRNLREMFFSQSSLVFDGEFHPW